MSIEWTKGNERAGRFDDGGVVMRFRPALLIGVVLLSVPFSTWATTYVVRPDGTGDFATIQAAVDAALAGDVIELTDGTFRGDGNRDVRYLGKAITIRSQNGNPEACIIDCEGSLSEPHRGFLFDQRESSGSVLQGVTVRHGYASGDGGAVYLSYYDASPVIAHCAFSENTSDGNGGALRLTEYGGSPTVSNCTFARNRANSSADGGGGAICAGWCAAMVSECTFTANSTNKYGGAVRLWPGSTAVFSRCEFRDNQARSGGAVHSGNATPTFVDCLMSSNHADSEGGALSAWSSGSLTRCLLIGNSAPEGGALFVVSGSPDINQSTFYGNSATAGSAIYCFGGLYPIPLQACIVAFGQGGEGLVCGDYCDVGYDLSCCDIFGNAGGDWVGCIATQADLNGNLSADPLFCDPQGGDFTLAAASPCLDAPGCGQIGAFGWGCNQPVAVLPTTWGQLKLLFRGPRR